MKFLKNPRRIFMIICLFLFGIIIQSSFVNVYGAVIKTQVLYLSEQQGPIWNSLNLDKDNLEITYMNSTDIDFSGINNYDVIVINDVVFSEIELNDLDAWSNVDGHGILIFMGPKLTNSNELLKKMNITEDTSFENNSGFIQDPDELTTKKGLSIRNTTLDPHLSPILQIEWNTAPETFYFSIIPNLNENVLNYIEVQWTGNLTKTNYPVVAGVQKGSNIGPNVYLFTGWFQEEYYSIVANEHFMIWPYFNYLIFITVQISAGNEVPVYGQWDFSPVPHLVDQIILGIFVAISTISSYIAFVKMKKRKPEQLESDIDEDIFKKSKEHIEDYERDKENIYVEEDNAWEKVGFHRQIAGFMKLFFVMVMLLIPQLLVTSIVMPRYLNPYPQAAGWYSYTLRFFEAIWVLFDLGFKYSITKYFAQHRLERPKKAYHYVQIFIWWQIFSGLVQIFIFAFLGAIIFPITNFSYLSWMFVVHSLIQFPGIYLVFQYFFQGTQRADYHMIAFALQYFVLRMMLQVITVPIFKAIYQNNVMYGPAFGAGIGLLVGQLLGDVVLLFITLKMYKGLGLPVEPIFGTEFTKEEFVESLVFGGKMVLGEIWVPLVWLLQVYLVGIYLPNSSAEQGYFELAFTLSTIPQAISLLMHSMLGGLTEAHEYKKENLLNYISFSGIKWGSIWTFFLCALFFAIGPEFIIGASGPNWARAAALIPYLMVYRILGPLSWQADLEFAAADKPLYAGISWIIEQSIRAILTFILLYTMRTMEAVIIAYIFSLATKDIVVVILIRKKIHKWDWNLWQAFIAPILSSIVIYIILRGLVYLLVDMLLGYGILSAMLLFVIGLFFMEYVFTFFVGLFGGYDDNTLEELNLATQMVTGVNKLAKYYYKSTAMGAKISPLHNKFKVEVFELAQTEAEELTSIKKKIVI